MDDGSTKDETPAICDEYAAKYPPSSKPSIRRSGGHGEGVNQGIRNATGLYYKVVDSDDWLDTDALKKFSHRLQTLVARGTAPDLMICNYVYQHAEDGTSHTVRYTNVSPRFRMGARGPFPPPALIALGHVPHRGARSSAAWCCPSTRSMWTTSSSTSPCYVKSMYDMDLDLYRYFIGRADQSVNESVMVKR